MKRFFLKYEVEFAFAAFCLVLFGAGVCLGLYPYVMTLK